MESLKPQRKMDTKAYRPTQSVYLKQCRTGGLICWLSDLQCTVGTMM